MQIHVSGGASRRLRCIRLGMVFLLEYQFHYFRAGADNENTGTEFDSGAIHAYTAEHALAVDRVDADGLAFGSGNYNLLADSSNLDVVVVNATHT